MSMAFPMQAVPVRRRAPRDERTARGRDGAPAIFALALALTVNPGKKKQGPDEADSDRGDDRTASTFALIGDKTGTPDNKSAKPKPPPW
jgi:hypothetical protein